MVGTILQKIFGTKSEREIRKMRPIVARINELEEEFEKYTGQQLRDKTFEWKRKIDQIREEAESQGKNEDEIRKLENQFLDEILPEAFAVVREASKRTLGMRHFDVQLIGGIVLHQGKIAEMKTGEGKTLVATLPVYLNALTGRGVHVVTVNDYLAKRDAEWMGRIYRFLGLTVGVIVSDLDNTERKKAYAADVTYGTNNEFGFDYLRDNMKYRLEDYVQRELNYAIVDEVDSILIDEARTPLIISGPSEESTELYYKIDSIIPLLKKDVHYEVDEEHNTAYLTEDGVKKVEELLGMDNLYAPGNVDIVHHVNQALKAHTLFLRDRDYIVKDGKVIIVDEFTGRLMPGRRWSDGLHQAIEAKEKVKIESENQTLATITFQNYFRMYNKLAGMTGTAATEAEEFYQIYGLEVIVVPTNKPMIRKDYPDVIYRTEKEKFNAVVEEIEYLHKQGRPVLVGTTSIEKSEYLSKLLRRKKIPHNVLNAKHHEREAEIVAQAGRLGMVTIATNMAGRGTDIILGGNPDMLAKVELKKRGIDPALVKTYLPKDELSEEEREATELYEELYEKFKEETDKEHEKVVELGGLHIIGTERHESRRIDNQLRGRAGRQGDPGSSRFYLSLEDDLLRIFGGERIAKIMDRLGMEEGEPIQHKMISKAIENAQKRVESQNFEIRKNLLEYDNVMNEQRTVVYNERRKILEGKEVIESLQSSIEDIIEELIEAFIPRKSRPDEWDIKGLIEEYKRIFNIEPPFQDFNSGDFERDDVKEVLLSNALSAFEEKRKLIGDDGIIQLGRYIMLTTLDNLWKDHLLIMDHLREGIGLRGYGQRDPLVEYKKEAFELFQQMIWRFKEQTMEKLYRVQIKQPEAVTELKIPIRQRRVMYQHGGSTGATSSGEAAKPTPIRKDKREIGRNDPCWCGSGKKYKNCHLGKEPETDREKYLYELYFTNPAKWEQETGVKLKKKSNK